MRRATAVVAASALALMCSTAQAADVTTNVEMHHHDSVNGRVTLTPQNHMFDGISLTEQQHQQLRDLMQQVRYDHSPISIDDLEHLHKLITAEKFDQAAYQAQVEKIAQAEVAHQVEIARIRNQMYQLLTPPQQAVLQQKYQQRVDSLRKMANAQPDSTLQAVHSNSSKAP